MNHQNMSRTSSRRVEDDRLVYYHRTANQGYWEDVWQKELNANYYKPFQAGRLFNFERMFKRHLPKDGLILEAGCGTAKLVIALQALGYRCLGLDYAIQALHKAQEMVGSMQLVSGDLNALRVSDDAFDALISIGVVEHRRAGPEPFLSEMRRILKPGGLLLISVPHFHTFRQWRAKRGAYQDDISGMDFYQYAFTRDEFCRILRNAGYEIEAVYSYSHKYGLSQELRWLKVFPPFLPRVLLKFSDFIPYIKKELGHMLMVVARKR